MDPALEFCMSASVRNEGWLQFWKALYQDSSTLIRQLRLWQLPPSKKPFEPFETEFDGLLRPWSTGWSGYLWTDHCIRNSMWQRCWNDLNLQALSPSLALFRFDSRITSSFWDHTVSRNGHILLTLKRLTLLSNLGEMKTLPNIKKPSARCLQDRGGLHR